MPLIGSLNISLIPQNTSGIDKTWHGWAKLFFKFKKLCVAKQHTRQKQKEGLKGYNLSLDFSGGGGGGGGLNLPLF